MTGDSIGEFDAIPVIDVSPLMPGAAAVARVAAVAQLRRMLESSGFAYLAGHGVPRELIDRLMNLSRAFHALPLAAKMRVAVNQANRGYLAFSTSTIVTSTVAKVTRPNQSESLVFMHELPPDHPARLAGKPLQGPNQWPEELPEFRAVVPEYFARMTELGRAMAGGIAEALGLSRDWFLPFLGEPTLGLRLLHYPRQPDEAELFGAAPHTDYGFITMLAQDSAGGLEVRNKRGDWIPARPVPGTFVMNVGDVLARWSNGRFASTPHRARNVKADDRYSMPFFFDPAMDATIACPPELIARGEVAAYPPVRFGDYLVERLDKNYDYRKKKAS